MSGRPQAYGWHSLLCRAQFSARWRGVIARVSFRGSLLSGSMMLVEIFAGTGCGTVTVAVTAPLDVVVVTETKTVTIEPDFTKADDPWKPSNSLMHSINYDYSDQNRVQLMAVTVPPKEVVMTETTPVTLETDLAEVYDPWMSFNGTIHTFNTDFFDTYFMKPVAGSYSEVVGEGWRRLIRNVLDNFTTPKRLINSLLVGKFGGAGRELSRFLINSTLGGLGMTDVAKHQFGIEKSDTDFGQTLEIWGWTTSRYLLVPFMPPLTLRDAVGTVVDMVMNPATIVFPIPFIGALAKDTLAYVNNRGLRLETDQNMEEPQYSELRSSYLVHRAELIQAR
jgi:phospholipid-binding lipoprotein MlaA